MQQQLAEQAMDAEDPLSHMAQHDEFSHYLGQDARYQGYLLPQPQNTPTWDAG